MTVDRPTEYRIGLVHELRNLPTETQWVEFKPDGAEEEEIHEYLACMKWVMRDYLTNVSLREPFGGKEKNTANVSRYIWEAVETGSIKPFDEDASKKQMKYVPFWT